MSPAAMLHNLSFNALSTCPFLFQGGFCLFLNWCLRLRIDAAILWHKWLGLYPRLEDFTFGASLPFGYDFFFNGWNKFAKWS
jgi:hypothetical protein